MIILKLLANRIISMHMLYVLTKHVNAGRTKAVSKRLRHPLAEDIVSRKAGVQAVRIVQVAAFYTLYHLHLAE